MLERAAANGRTGELADALYGLVEYWRYTGLIQPSLAKVIEERIAADGTTFEQVETFFALGTLANARFNVTDAQERSSRHCPCTSG